MNRSNFVRNAPQLERPLGGLRALWNDNFQWILLLLALIGTTVLAQAQITIAHLGTYATGSYDAGAAEIADFDPINDRIWFTNAQANSIIGLNASNPASPSLFITIPMGAYGAGVNSVVVLSNGFAAAMESNPKTDPGKVVFFDLNGVFISQVTVGALPDMVTVTPDGTKVISVNEGEPNTSYTIDPVGSVSIIDVTGGLASLTNANVTTLDFSSFTLAMLPGVRIFGPGASVAQDMEPEYVTVSDDSQTAFIAFQENNAVAKINLATNTITQVTALGYKNHNLAGNGLDASDNPASVNITTWPVRGFYMPDAAHAFTIGGQTYVVYANEGDVREYTGSPGYVEALRVGNAAVVLDPVVFPNAATLKLNANLGRLNISKANGNTDADSEYEELYAFGTRSFSIRDANGALVYDSGDDLEVITAAAYPANFNASNTNNTLDNRSDDKGPEPEAVTTGVINGKTYAFIGLERVGGIMVFDVSNPFAPVFVQYLNNRNFGAATNTPAALDLGMEGITFVSAADSPNGVPFLITSNEISGTVSTFQVLGCTVGASCDDGNPSTVNDVYNASCQCLGTTPAFGSGNLVVLQAGNGTGTLVNTGNPILLREFTSTGTPGNTVNVPSTGGSSMIISGSATSEGNLSLSGDGTKLIFAGYAQALPNATPLAASNSGTINRAVGSVTSSGAFTRNLTSSTFFTADNPRSAASDGTNFWGTGGNQGVNYWGPSTAATIATSKTNLRASAVFNGQLYVSSASASGTPNVTGVFAVGSGLPTTTGQTLTTLAATVNTSTNGFYLSPAGNTLYVTIGTVGIQKWVNSSGWSLAYTMTFTGGANSVVADFSGVNPILYAVSSAGAQLLKFTDPNSGSGSVPVTTTLLATAPANTAFRGISFAPCTPTTWYADVDNDGFGNPNATTSACSQPVGFVGNNTDLCPADGTKQAPGVCGCGVADVPTTYYADTDGDGFGNPASPLAGFTCIVPTGYVANNTDLCPADGTKQAPGVCGCGTPDVPTTYYADADADGFGDPASPVAGSTCIVPPGTVANNTDNCVATANASQTDADGDGFGDACDNCVSTGNASQTNADGDLLGDACDLCPNDANNDQDGDGICGDVDNCPTVFGQIGNICDANPGPGFTLGEINASCVCAAATCTQNLTIEFQTDANPGQITWELREQGTNALVQSDGPSAPGGIQTMNTCVPNGCYYLKVIDSAGDGMVNGGYILRTAGSPGTRLIDNRRNFNSGSLSQIAVGEGFCIPLGTTTNAIFTSCDKLDWVTGEYVVCGAVPAVSALWSAGNLPAEAITGYEFQIFNPNGGYLFNRFRSHGVSDGFAPDNATRACHMKINNWGIAQQIPANVLMNVRVRTRTNGVNGNWGPACRFMINPVAAACPLTKLIDTPGNANLSCGQTRAFATGQYVHARPVTGATQYQFRFRIDAENFVSVRTSNTYFVQLNWLTSPLQNGKTYQVEVRAFKNGAWCINNINPSGGAPFVQWGDVCDLTIDNTPANGGNQNMLGDGQSERSEGLSMYPNPNRGDQLYLSLDAVEEGVRTVSVDIFDLTGQRVSARTIAVADGLINTVLDLDSDMANGMYLVNITAGDQHFTERLVIQK